ncbi:MULTISPECIES: hypothetical protein [Streptomyces]|uniref:Secreted protein n=1 Tax=Streptomyces qinglanensis TaxID=943816 RepID=A0A1H9S047_9ACTN|nr:MULTISPECIES: hypothetical protein [Streptomyces]SER77713.1 hypothetical protein SAMN05421870_104159 [Streptomyces qinglanensis]
MRSLGLAGKASAAVALAFAATLLMPTTPAAASDWDRSCYHIKAPYKGISEVIGGASKARSSCEDATISLQRHRWYGWQEVDWTPLYSGSPIAWWTCTGSGTYTYKTVVAVDSNLGIYESAERRITC